MYTGEHASRPNLSLRFTRFFFRLFQRPSPKNRLTVFGPTVLRNPRAPTQEPTMARPRAPTPKLVQGTDPWNGCIFAGTPIFQHSARPFGVGVRYLLTLSWRITCRSPRVVYSALGRLSGRVWHGRGTLQHECALPRELNHHTDFWTPRPARRRISNLTTNCCADIVSCGVAFPGKL